MKTIYIVRHSKSSWEYEDVHDFDRPLSESGIHKSFQVGRFLNENRIKPALLISSPATRAISTAIIYARQMDYLVENIRMDEAVYEASLDEMLKVIHQTEDSNESLMIVGHNPSSIVLAEYLLGTPVKKIPTGSVLSIVCERNTWTDIDGASGKLNFFVTPKSLREK